MASKSELWSQLRYIIKFLDHFYFDTALDTVNIKTMIADIQANYAGNHIQYTDKELANFRSSVGELLTNSSPLDAVLIELAQIGYYSQNTDVASCLSDIAYEMAKLSETVKNRAYTIGSITANVSNVGNGVILSTYKDKYNNTIESGYQTAGTLKFEVDTDRFSGATSGKEIFNVYTNGLPYVDPLDYGSGISLVNSLTVMTNDDNIVSNGTFENYESPVATDSVTDWTITTPANLTYETTTVFRDNVVSLKFTGNNTLTQSQDSFKQSFDKFKPLGIIVRVYRQSSADGTLTIGLGSKTEATAVNTLSNGAWNNIYFGNNTVNGWYDNFKQDTINLTLAYSSWSTGSILIGEILMLYGTQFDNQIYTIVAGSTDFIKNDYFTQTNSVANTGRIQTLLSKYYNTYLPHTSGTPTYADF